MRTDHLNPSGRFAVVVTKSTTGTQVGNPLWFAHHNDAAKEAQDINRYNQDKTWNYPIAHVIDTWAEGVAV